MSWSRRGVVLAVAAAAGCGFTPALAPGGAAGGLRGKIEVAPRRSFPSYALTRRLEERLGLPESPEYVLDVVVTLGSEITGIPADRVTARQSIVGQADYTLRESATGTVARRGRVEGFAGFSTTSTTAATRAARADAEDRLMTILADRLVAELVATAEAWRG